jgi:hypothetical protein
MSQLLVVSWNRDLQISRSELLNLDPTTESCSSLPNLSTFMMPMAGQLYNERDPIICGSLGFDVTNCTNACYLFKNGNWKEIPTLNICSYGFSMSSFIHQNQNKLITTGGYDLYQHFATVEYFDGKKWTIDKNSQLLEAIAGHCMVKLNSSFLMLIGGEKKYLQSTTKTWFFNTLTGHWSAGPDLITARSSHSCGIMNWLNPRNKIREKVVVVAGGDTGHHGKTDSVELLFLSGYDLFQKNWVKGQNLPSSSSGSSLFEFQNGLIIVGGWAHRHLYHLSAPNESWVEMKYLLKEPVADSHVAFLIPNYKTNCH